MKVFTALQQPYVYLLNLLVPYVKKISGKWRDIIVEIALGMIIFIPFYEDIFIFSPVPHSATFRPLISCLFFLIAVVFSIKGEIRPVRLNHGPVVFFALYIVTLTAAFIIKLIPPERGSRAELLSWFVIYAALLPMLFIIWTNRGDLSSMYQKLTRPYSCIFTMYCGAMILRGDWADVQGELRLTGTTTHPNTMAILIFTGMTCCLYHLLTEEFSVLSGIYGLGFCLGSFTLKLTGSRTTLLGVIAAMLVMVVYVLMKKNRKATFVMLGACAAAVVFFLLAGPYYNSEMQKVFLDEAVVSASEADAEAAKAEMVEAEMAALEASRENRVSMEGKNLNGILNNRPVIWKNYFKYMNSFGTDTIDRYVLLLKSHQQTGVSMAGHAHNHYIQMAFDYGAVPISFSLLIAISAAVYVGFCVFGRYPFEKHAVFSIFAICEFCITAIPEYCGRPLYTVVSLLYIFALVPVFCHQKPEPDEPAAEAEAEAEQ